MAEGRRIRYDDEDDDLYSKLGANNVFKGLDLMDLFSIALVMGKKSESRLPLGKSAIGKIRASTFSSTNLPYLMMAIAADTEDSFDVLADDEGEGRKARSAEDKYMSIAEEYAKSGLSLFSSDFVSSDDIIEDMEEEMLEFYDKYIENDNSN